MCGIPQEILNKYFVIVYNQNSLIDNASSIFSHFFGAYFSHVVLIPFPTFTTEWCALL